MKTALLVIISLALCKVSVAQISLTAAPGSNTGVGQSFNENRGVDIQLLSTSSLTISSMTLNGFYSGFTGTDSAYVGARIYKPSTGALLAASTDSVFSTVSMGLRVTVPISFTFLPDSIYRVSFYCYGPNMPTHNSGYMFQPTAIPYTEATNHFKILAAWDYITDTMPVYTNIFVPLITLDNIATGYPEINMAAANSIYPNPFTQQATLTFNEEQKNTDIEITDMLGKTIKSMRCSGKELLIEKGGMQAGVYILRIINETKDVESKKIIIE
jgi:hypothetical protein